MVGALLQLHHNIEQGDLSPTLGIQHLKVSGEDVLVDLLLEGGQVGAHNEL